jgi:hypothetical protein
VSRILLALGTWLAIGAAAQILTNNIHIASAPAWLTESRVDKVVSHIQETLEWDIRRIEVYFYTDQAAFQRMHGGGPWVEALFKHQDSTIHLGPNVTTGDFDAVFGHELVHVILYQKYKGAIPDWLEEGLANFLAQKGTVDYRWLAKQPFQDVTSLGHPFNHQVDPHYHYQASQAIAEMVNAKCDLHDLLQMAVGSSFQLYLANICGITDVNAAFRSWIAQKAGNPVKPGAKYKTS